RTTPGAGCHIRADTAATRIPRRAPVARPRRAYEPGTTHGEQTPEFSAGVRADNASPARKSNLVCAGWTRAIKDLGGRRRKYVGCHGQECPTLCAPSSR